MRRINYLVSPAERLIGIALPRRVPATLHEPFAALVSALALIGVLHGVQQARLATAMRDGRALAERLAQSEARVARVRIVEDEVAGLTALSRRIAELEGTGTASASELAAIGNRIPRDARLSTIRSEAGGGYAIDGSGSGLGVVGRTMASLADLHTFTGVRLVAIHDDRGRSEVSYSLVLERKR